MRLADFGHLHPILRWVAVYLNQCYFDNLSFWLFPTQFLYDVLCSDGDVTVVFAASLFLSRAFD